MLSRPDLSADARPYWEVAQFLGRYRPIIAGFGVAFPRAVDPEVIRREGERRGYQGVGLEEFVAIVAAIDDAAVEIEMKRLRDEARKKTPKPTDRRGR